MIKKRMWSDVSDERIRKMLDVRRKRLGLGFSGFVLVEMNHLPRLFQIVR